MPPFNLEGASRVVADTVLPAAEKFVSETVVPAVEKLPFMQRAEELLSKAPPVTPPEGPPAPLRMRTSTNPHIEGDFLNPRESVADAMFRPTLKPEHQSKLYSDWGYTMGKYLDPISGEVKDLPDVVTVPRGKSDRRSGELLSPTVDKSPLYNQWFFRNSSSFRASNLPSRRQAEIDAMQELDGMSFTEALSWAKQNLDKVGTQRQMYEGILNGLEARLKFIEYSTGSKGVINTKGVVTESGTPAFYWQHPDAGIGHAIFIDRDRGSFGTLVHELTHAAHHSLLLRTEGAHALTLNGRAAVTSSFPETWRTTDDMPADLKKALDETRASYNWFVKYTKALARKIGQKDLKEVTKYSGHQIDSFFQQGKITSQERNILQSLVNSDTPGWYAISDMDEFTTHAYMDRPFQNVLAMVPARGRATAREHFISAVQHLIGKDTSGSYPDKNFLSQMLGHMEDIRAAASGERSSFAESTEQALLNRRLTAHSQSVSDVRYTRKTPAELNSPEFIDDVVDEDGAFFKGDLGSFKYEKMDPRKAKTTSRREFRNYLDHAVAGQWYYGGAKPTPEMAAELMNKIVGQRASTAPLEDAFSAKVALKNAEGILRDVFASNPIWDKAHGFLSLSPEMRASQLGDWFSTKFGADGVHVEKLFNLVAEHPELTKNPARFNRVLGELYANWKLGNLGAEGFKPSPALETLYRDASNMMSGRMPSLKRSSYLPELDMNKNVDGDLIPGAIEGPLRSKRGITTGDARHRIKAMDDQDRRDLLASLEPAQQALFLITENERPADPNHPYARSANGMDRYSPLDFAHLQPDATSVYSIEGCTVELGTHEDARGKLVLYVHTFESNSGVGKGAGTRAMIRMCEYADKVDSPMELMACPFPNPKDGNRMDLETLVGWYERFGFQPLEEVDPAQGSCDMRREPNEQALPQQKAPLGPLRIRAKSGVSTPSGSYTGLNERQPLPGTLAMRDIRTNEKKAPHVWPQKKANFAHTVQIGGTRVQVERQDGGEALFIHDIMADWGSRRGDGTAAMKKILEYADKHGARVELNATPTHNIADQTTIPLSKLIDWYESMGFVVEGPNEHKNGVYMSRVPNSDSVSARRSTTPDVDRFFERLTGDKGTSGAITLRNEVHHIAREPNAPGEVIAGHLRDTTIPKQLGKIVKTADITHVTMRATLRQPVGWKPPEAPPAIDVDTHSFVKNAKATGLVDKVLSGEEIGATFNNDGTKYTGDGLVVPIRSIDDVKAADLTPEKIASFLRDKAPYISSDAFRVGIYHFPNEDRYSIDLNLLVEQKDKSLAMKVADWCRQKSVFDMSDYSEIPTGHNGKDTRKLSAWHSRLLAQEIERGQLPQFMEAPRNQVEAYIAEGFQPLPSRNNADDIRGIIHLRRTPQE